MCARVCTGRLTWWLRIDLAAPSLLSHATLKPLASVTSTGASSPFTMLVSIIIIVVVVIIISIIIIIVIIIIILVIIIIIIVIIIVVVIIIILATPKLPASVTSTGASSPFTMLVSHCIASLSLSLSSSSSSSSSSSIKIHFVNS
jgi:hypothetical protein